MGGHALPNKKVNQESIKQALGNETQCKEEAETSLDIPVWCMEWGQKANSSRLQRGDRECKRDVTKEKNFEWFSKSIFWEKFDKSLPSGT